MLFTATTCTEYTVNGVRPVTVSSVVADVKTDVFPLPSPTTCSVIWYIRMRALLSAGSSHSKKMDVVLVCTTVSVGCSGESEGEKPEMVQHYALGSIEGEVSQI